jgi:hypothetical protein
MAPDDDELAGIDWWNAMEVEGREYWMEQAGNSGRAADAWAIFKRERDKPLEWPDVNAMTDAEYNAYFTREVRLGIDDPRPGIPHEQVVREMRAHQAKRRRELAERNALSSDDDQSGD